MINWRKHKKWYLHSDEKKFDAHRESNERKVVHVIDHMGFGGAQKIAYGIVKKNEQEILILNERKKELNLSEIRYKHIGNLNKFNIISLFVLYKYIKKNSVEILHVHLIKSYFACLFVKMFFYQNLILIVHDHGEGAFPEPNLKRFLYRLSLKMFSRHINKYIAVSEFGKNLIEPYVSSVKITVLYNFIEDIFFQKDKILKTKSHFAIGFAGRIEQHKGIEEFVNMITILTPEYPEIRFLIAGDGSQKNWLLTQLKNLGLEDRVECLGFVRDMEEFYLRVNIFVNPSHYESMGLTHIEAMAMGVPVIVSDVPAINTMLTDSKNCYFFEKGNAVALTNKIKLLINSEEIRKKFSEEGRNFAENFRKENYMRNLNKMYMELRGDN